jgi:hypothetical protein
MHTTPATPIHEEPLPRAVAKRITAYWRDGSGAQRWLFSVGTLLVVVGIAHLVPAAVGDRPWQGPISFRKPFLFGVSFGLSCVTLGWMLAYLRVGRRWAVALTAMLGAGAVVEVAAVSLQAFRGVPSHFNVTTGAFNAAVFSVMGLAVTFIAAAILAASVWSFTHLEAPAPLALGIRAGLLLLLASQALGGQMIVHGLEQVAAQSGQEPNVFGAAGQLKVPHAVTVHAAQVLPGIAWLLGFSRWPGRSAVGVTAAAVAGYASLTAVAALQTFSGRAPVDLLPTSGALLLVAAVLLGGAGAATVVALRTRGRPPVAAPGGAAASPSAGRG